MNASTSMSPASQRSTNSGTPSRPLTPPKDEPAMRRPVIRKRGTTSSVSPLAGDACDGAQAPTHPRRLDGLTHHRDVAGRLERVVGAEPAGRLDDLVDRVGPSRASSRSRHAHAQGRGALPRGRRRRSARRPAGGSRSRRRDRPSRHRRRHTSSPPRPSRCSSPRPRPVESPQANKAAPSRGASGLTFASAISGMTVYSANVDVPMKCRTGSPSSDSRVVPSGRKPLFCCSRIARQRFVRSL